MKKGYALFVAMSYENNFEPLISAYPSADIILNSFKSVERSSFFPMWTYHEDYPVLINKREDLIHLISSAARHADQSGNELIFLYIVGHGYGIEGEEIFIQSDDSVYAEGNRLSGISIADVIDNIQISYSGNVIIVLDVCRNQLLTKVAGRDSLQTLLKRKSVAFESLMLVTSTTHGNFAQGGFKDIDKSPYSIALSKFITNESNLVKPRHPKTELEKVFTEILVQVYNETNFQLHHENVSIYPYSIKGKNYTFFAVPLNIDIASVRSKIIDREKVSFQKDSFLESVDDVWYPSFKTLHQHPYKIENIIHDSRSIIITAQHGYGKTISGKYLSLVANSQQERSIWFYLNVKKIEQYDKSQNIIFNNIKKWRYFITDFISNATIDEFIKKHSIVIVLDFIDDFHNDELLKKILNDLVELKIRFIALCQNDNVEKIKRFITDTSILVLLLEPYSINNCSDIEIENRFKLNKDLNLTGDPISIHNVRLFKNKHKRFPSSTSEIDFFILKNIMDEISKFNNEINQCLLKPVFTIFKDREVFNDDKSSLYILCLISKLFFKLYKDFRAFSFNEPYIEQFLRKEHPEANTKDLLTIILKILIRTKTIRQDGGRNTPIRVSHNTNAFRLITVYFHYYISDIDEIISISRDNEWLYTIAKYVTIFVKSEDIFQKLCKNNPFCAAQSIQLGYKYTKSNLKELINELLKNCSIWTRNKTSATLGNLPYIVREVLFTSFSTYSIEKRTTVVLALGYQTDNNSVDMLKSIYVSLLKEQQNEEISYLRRRTLDSLKDKIDVFFVKKNHIHDLVEENEWSRILRSINREYCQEDDFIFLLNCTKKICKSDLSLDILRNTYLEKLNKSTNTPIINLSNERRVLNTIKKALKSNIKWHKCITILFLEELKALSRTNFIELSELLLKLFFTDEHLHVKGDIAYVYGLFATEKGIKRLVQYYKTEIKKTTYNKDLLNDLAIGFSRAINYINRDFYQVLADYGLEHIYQEKITEFNG